MAREGDGCAQERWPQRARREIRDERKVAREEQRSDKGAGEIRLSDSGRRGGPRREENAFRLERREKDERRQREEDAPSRLKFGRQYGSCWRRGDRTSRGPHREENAYRLDKCKRWERDERRQRKEDAQGPHREENACRLDKCKRWARYERFQREEDARSRIKFGREEQRVWRRDKGAGEIMLSDFGRRGDRPGRGWHREENAQWHKQGNWSRKRQRVEGGKSKEKHRQSRPSMSDETEGNGEPSLWKHHRVTKDKCKLEERSMKRQRRQSKGTRHATKQQDWRWHLNKAGAGKEAEAALRADVGASSRDLCPEQCLPFHLIVEHILVRLPVRHLCQLRCVCKAWNSLLTEKAGAFLKVEEEEYWFVSLSVSNGKSLGVFSTNDICHPLPLPNSKLLSYLGGGISRLADGWHRPEIYLLASAGGLMCAIVHATAGFDVIVFNCLTGSLKVLPQPLNIEFLLDLGPCQIYIAVDSEDSGRYYVVLMHSSLSLARNDFYYFEVFDSKFGSWKVGQTSESATVKSSGMKVPHGDFFLFGGDYGVINVVAYHAAQDVWSTVQVPPDPHTMSSYAFLKYKGRLFKCSPIFNDSDLCGIEVWELHITCSETATWVEVARTPEHLFQPVSYDAQVKAGGHLFYIASCSEGRGLDQPSLWYNVACNSWHVLPSMDGSYLVTLHRPVLSLYLD